MAGGYTPPRKAPVANRAAIRAGVDSSGITRRLVAAASMADTANSVREVTRSEGLVNAITRVPNTNPSWTAIVRRAIDDSSIDFSTSRAPDIAFVENQTESEKNVATETSRSALDRELVFYIEIGCAVSESRCDRIQWNMSS